VCVFEAAKLISGPLYPTIYIAHLTA